MGVGFTSAMSLDVVGFCDCRIRGVERGLGVVGRTRMWRILT